MPAINLVSSIVVPASLRPPPEHTQSVLAPATLIIQRNFLSYGAERLGTSPSAPPPLVIANVAWCHAKNRAFKEHFLFPATLDGDRVLLSRKNDSFSSIEVKGGS